jgi:hypothetical protein
MLARAICTISLMSAAMSPVGAQAAQDGGFAPTRGADKADAATTRTLPAVDKRKPKRRGGKVRTAWPANSSAPRPRNQLARWLARQVGTARRSELLFDH